MKAPESFKQACQAIERRELALALFHADAVGREHSSTAEASVLTAFIHRRAEREAEGWVDALLASWESCGRPTRFSFLKGVSFEQLFDDSVVDGNGGEVLAQFFDANAGVLQRNWMLNSPQVLFEGAKAQLAQARGTVEKLAIAGQLAATKREPDLREPAQALIAPLLREIAAANPTTFELASLSVIDEIDQLGRLEAGHVDALLELLERDRRPNLAHELYQDLVKRRGSLTAAARRMAWLDAIAIKPDPSFTIHRRARAAVEKPAGLVKLLDVLGAREAASPLLMARIIGLELQRLAAELEHRDAAAIAVRLAAARALTDEPGRFELDWPIEPLMLETIDRLAEDEHALMSRCAFPRE